MFLSSAPKAFAGSADALVLSCMDYRLANDVHAFMDSLGMTDKYDHVVLAGASAGVLHPEFNAWHDTFWSHLDVAVSLHGIHRVIVIDHHDCGACKIAFGPEHAADAAAETALHSEWLAKMGAEVKARKPDLSFEGYLMAIDGSVEALQV